MTELERQDVIAFLYARIRMLVAPDVILQLSSLVLLFAGLGAQQVDLVVAGGIAVILTGLVALPLINRFHAARVTEPDERTINLPFDRVLELVAKRTSKLANLSPSSRRATVDQAVARGRGSADATFTRQSVAGTLSVNVRRFSEDKTVVSIRGAHPEVKYMFRIYGIRIPYLYGGSHLHRLRREMFYFLDYHASRARRADGQAPDVTTPSPSR